jgi:hypothetical protein
LDSKIPGVDGLALLKKIKQRNVSIESINCTKKSVEEKIRVKERIP